ncbi:hypothetical protein GZH53_01555 [Flavihumibacter sp. R14]|nr:hypothetical protein [Flavihumibacter soli]
MNETLLNKLSEVEELECILKLHDQAKKYLRSFDWCVEIKKSWYDHEYGIFEKVGVFLFEIQPIDEGVDDFIWVIVGDLPSVYLDKSITTARRALETYCELMEDWVENVVEGRSVLESYPVPVDPNIENAELLSSRIRFIRRELLLT